MSTKLTVEVTYYDNSTDTVTIERDAWDLTAGQFIEELVLPLMRGIGYPEKYINEALGGGEDVD